MKKRFRIAKRGVYSPATETQCELVFAVRLSPEEGIFGHRFGVSSTLMAKLVAPQSHTSSVETLSASSDTSDFLQPELNERLASPVVARGRCAQCGKTLRHMTLFVGNITCQECYGAERYSRGPGVPIGASSLSAPVVDKTYTA